MVCRMDVVVEPVLGHESDQQERHQADAPDALLAPGGDLPAQLGQLRVNPLIVRVDRLLERPELRQRRHRCRAG